MDNELTLERIRQLLASKKVVWEEKRMFGGNCFMVDDKMCFGTYRGGLMARVQPDLVPNYLTRNGAEQMIHGGRTMKGYLWISPEGYDMEVDLEYWIDQCLAFNPSAKSSKKKK